MTKKIVNDVNGINNEKKTDDTCWLWYYRCGKHKSYTRVNVVKSINEINNEKTLTFISKMITLLSRQADELDKKIRDIKKVAARVRKNLNDFDALTSKCDFMSRYGFDGDEMFYIGVASGRVYRRPINKKIVEKIERAKKMDWKEIGEIGDYFLYGKIAEEEVAEEEAEEETEEDK